MGEVCGGDPRPDPEGKPGVAGDF
ncbi:hypothetical protein LINPERPRIM_LOCUS5119 [Linum perenne]